MRSFGTRVKGMRRNSGSEVISCTGQHTCSFQMSGAVRNTLKRGLPVHWQCCEEPGQCQCWCEVTWDRRPDGAGRGLPPAARAARSRLVCGRSWLAMCLVGHGVQQNPHTILSISFCGCSFSFHLAYMALLAPYVESLVW